MQGLKINQLFLVFTIILGNFGLSSTAYAQAQASEQNEIRYIQEMAKYYYEQNKDQAFTVQEVLDEGYDMCTQIAEQGGWENLAQDAIRSGLGLGNDQPEENNQEMARLADKYLCDS